MTDHAVVIAGGGPTGMMLAAELRLAGIDVAIVEPRSGHELEGSRSRGLHARTIEVLDQRGVADRFLAEGQAMQVQSFGMIPLDISDFPTRHNYGLALRQQDFERILGGWADELGVRFHRGCSVTGFTQDDSGVDIYLDDGRALRADYLVGCDGGRSPVRKSAGIEFAGCDPSVSSLIAEVSMSEEPTWGIRRDRRGQHALAKLDGDARVGVVVTEEYTGQSGEPTLDELRRALVSVWGTDFGVHSPTWLSRFTDATRQAVTYRVNRVLLAGDAVHIHYPVGGQGLNLGVQDAVNLGWKLAQVVAGTSPDSLLDTYQAERHPVAARVLRTTMAASALLREDERVGALRDTLTELLRMDEPRKSVAGIISGLDIHYDLGGEHPLVGRRVPDLDVETTAGITTVFGLLHRARPVLLNLVAATADITPWATRVQLVQATCGASWEVPVVGDVSAPDAVLVRPDGYVAWVGEPDDPGLATALTTWFGTPAPTENSTTKRGATA